MPGTPPERPASGRGQIVRVLSYNLRDFKDDADAAARVIRAVDPDLVCLQEVPRRLGSSNRVSAFAAKCCLTWAGGHRGSGGTTVMSGPRVELTNVRHHRLTVPPLQRRRGYAVGVLQLPGHHSIMVASVHLSLDGAERAAHAATILRALPADCGVVLAGDLNEGSGGQAWKTFGQGLDAVSGDAPTFPANGPRQRLDVIFVSSHLTAVPGSPVELDPSDLVAATDHLPVWVDLDLSNAVLPERLPQSLR